MDVKSIAKRLNIPMHVVEYIRDENWEQVYGYFKYRWNQDGYVAWKRNQKAVERVISEFRNVANSDYQANDTARKSVGLFVQRLGVKVLINDIREAVKATPQIRTLMYFLRTQQGEKLSRWGNLHLEKVNAEIAAEKRERDEAERDVGRRLFGEGSDKNTIAKVCDHSQGVEPEWLRQDRERLAELAAMDKGRMDVKLRGELALLKMRLSKIKKGKWRVK